MINIFRRKIMKRGILACLVVLLLSAIPAVVSAAGAKQAGTQRTIGMVSFSMAQEWYQNIAAGAQNRAEALGAKLLITDGNNDANAQVTAIDNFITQKVDAIIVSPADVKALASAVKRAKDAGIKVICESNMVEGADTKVGMSDFENGRVSGEWLANYAKAKGITLNILILGYQSLENCRNRAEGFKAALNTSGVVYTIPVEVDGGFRKESLDATIDALTAHPEINTVFGINDDSTLGAISAVKQAGRSLDDFTMILFGLEGVAGRTALYDGSANAGLSMFPEYVGTTCVNSAMDAIEGKALPKEYLSPTTVVTRDDFKNYFIEQNGKFLVNFEAVQAMANSK
jgi:ABC-type sugar transport system substrate-binding protein